VSFIIKNETSDQRRHNPPTSCTLCNFTEHQPLQSHIERPVNYDHGYVKTFYVHRIVHWIRNCRHLTMLIKRQC